MFNNRKIQKLENKVNSLSNWGSDAPVNENSEDYIIAKITGSVLNSDKTYDYSWQAINEDGSNDTGQGSGVCRCIQERGKNMTGKSPLAENNTIIYVYADGGGFHFSVAGGGSEEGVLSPVLDLTDEDNDGFGWEDGKKTVDGEQTGNETAVKFRFLQRMEYDPDQDQNFEYYRELTIDSKGKLRISGVIQEVGGFETTQHPDE